MTKPRMNMKQNLYLNFKIKDLMITMSHDQHDSDDCPWAYSLDDCSPCTDATGCGDESSDGSWRILRDEDLRAMRGELAGAMQQLITRSETVELPDRVDGLELLESKLKGALEIIAKQKARLRR